MSAQALTGKTAIVTGASRSGGMGFAAAKALAQQGANVVVTGVMQQRDDLGRQEYGYSIGGSEKRLLERVAELESFGVKAMAVNCDLTDSDSIRAMVKTVADNFDSIDILFNNAGTVVGVKPFLEVTDQDWMSSYLVHMKGVSDTCQAVIPLMQKNGGGSIINNSSIWALKNGPGATAYVATKMGLLGLTKGLASEFGSDNIRVNAICPGTIVTGMNDMEVQHYAEQFGISEDEARRQMDKDMVLGRCGNPDEIGQVVAFLASDASSYITGAFLPIDGGIQVGL